MVCGNFREGICKDISLNDIAAERLLKLLQLACGQDGVVVEDVEEMVELGELADRLQLEAVRNQTEDKLSKGLRVENCTEVNRRSEASGLDLLQKECYKMLRDGFEVIWKQDAFLMLSAETLKALLEEDELGVDQEEDVFEAVVRWISCDEGMRGVVLLRKIRYGVMSNEYLAGLMVSESLPRHGMVKELVGEAMAKKGGAGGEWMWDGVERLCDKWVVARRMKGRIMGAVVLEIPRYVALDGQGRIIVSNLGLHEVVVLDRSGTVARRFGSYGTVGGHFDHPMGVAVDRQGHIIVADYGNDRIQILNADGSVARCFGANGSAVGQLNEPCGVAIDREGHIVVADRGNHRIQVFDETGSVVRHFGSRGAALGQFDRPTGVGVDGAGRIVVADSGNHRVQVFNGDGSVALCFGSEGDGPGQLKHPWGVAVDSAGRFVVGDTSNNRVQWFNSDGSVARVMGSEGNGVGQLCRSCGVIIDGAGRVFVADRDNNRLQVL